MKIFAAIFICILFTSCASGRKTPMCGNVGYTRTKSIIVTVVRCDTKTDFEPFPGPTAPVVIFYPLEMFRAGISGEVRADMRISKEGKIIDFSFIRYSHPEFRDAVSRLAPSLRFSPAKRDDQAIECGIEAKIEFKAEEED